MNDYDGDEELVPGPDDGLAFHEVVILCLWAWAVYELLKWVKP